MLSSLTKGALEALQGFIIWLKGPEAGEGKERALAESSKNITSREEADSILKQGVPLLASLKKEQDAVERSKPIQAPTNLVWGLGGVGGPPDTRYAKYLESMENIGKRRNDLESAIAEAKTFIAKKGADATGQTGQSPQTSNQSSDQTGGGTPPLTGVPPPPPTTHPANDPDAERRKLEADRKRLEDERKQDAREAQNITQRFNLSQKQFEASIAAIRANPYISQKEKNELLNEKFREERNSLSGRLALANGMAQGEVDGSSRQAAYLAEGRRVEERQQAVGNDVDATDATTVFEDYEQGIAKLRSSFKSLGQSLADGVGSTMSSLSDHLGKLVMGTETWGQALNGIWHTFGQSMLRAFTDMVAQWAINKARMFAIDALFSMKSLALSAANAAKNLVLWIPSAIAASISSFGTAAAIGAAAVIAALAIKGFSEGGYTGSGGRLEPAGIVHRGEMVFSQADIARHGGVAAVEALRLSGGMSGRGAGVTASPSAGGVGGPAIGDGQAAVNIAYFNTRQNAETWLASQRGTRVLKDWMRDNRYDT
jgi:hypothetical protein